MAHYHIRKIDLNLHSSESKGMNLSSMNSKRFALCKHVHVRTVIVFVTYTKCSFMYYYSCTEILLKFSKEYAFA